MYEGLNFSHVKFYRDLSAGLKKKYRENLKISAITGRLPVKTSGSEKTLAKQFKSYQHLEKVFFTSNS